MARRRMIDPNFWQSEDVSKLSVRQRLLFIGLFSNADDEGKLRGNPAFVRSIIFPYEDFAMNEIEQDLNDIEGVGSILQYNVEGSKYILLCNWKKFQRVDKPQSSVIPDPNENYSKNDSENESENDSRLSKSNRSEVEVKGKESNTRDTRSNLIEIIERYCQLHNKIDPHISDKERTAMRELSESGVPIEFILETMNQLFDYKAKKKEKITSFQYYPDIIKDAYKRQSLPQAAGGETNAKFRRSDPSRDSYYEQLREISNGTI